MSGCASRLAIGLVMFVSACGPSRPVTDASRMPEAGGRGEPSAPATPPAGPSRVPPPQVPPPAEVPTVFFSTPTGEVAVQVEVARTSEARQAGLMHRQTLPAGHGMLFLMPSERVQMFWMRNTFIPLDMIFVNGAREVVGIVAEAEPLTETPRMVAAPSSYVVEIPGGHAAQMGIGAGSRMRTAGVPELAR